MTFIRGSDARKNRQTVISDAEFAAMLEKANQLPDEFQRLRARALLSVLRLTGKRRSEVASLALSSFAIELTGSPATGQGLLHITFSLSKKRRASVITRTSTKSIPLSDPLTTEIIAYLKHLLHLSPKPRYFLPRLQPAFGINHMIHDEHISGRQVFNIVRDLDSAVWPHLFRETVASDVVKQDPSLIGVFKVQQRLDLSRFETGFAYVRRYAGDVIRREAAKLDQEPKS